MNCLTHVHIIYAKLSFSQGFIHLFFLVSLNQMGLLNGVFKEVMNKLLFLVCRRCVKGTVSLVYNCLKVISFESHCYRQMVPDLQIFLTSSYLEVLMLQNHSNYHFNFECDERLLSAHSQCYGSYSIFIINTGFFTYEQKYLEPVLVFNFQLAFVL